MPVTIDGYGYEVNLPVGAREFPREVMPGAWGWCGTTDTGRDPSRRRAVPDAPGPGAVEVAFGAVDVTLSPHVLIHIKFQSLSRVQPVGVKIEIVSEVRRVVLSAEPMPPESSAPRCTSNPEFS